MGWLRKIVCIVLIVVAIMYGLAWLFPTMFEGALLAPIVALVGGNVGVAAVVALVGAAIVDPATVTQVIEKVAAVATSVGTAVGNVVSNTATGVLTSFLTSPVGIAVCGIGLYLLLRTNKSGDNMADRYADAHFSQLRQQGKGE